jgi:hypothetical protein
MKAFEVLVNGQPQCLAGIGETGSMHVIVTCTVKMPSHLTFCVRVGGLDASEHSRWHVPPIGLGDELLVRLTESSVVDPPIRRISRAPEGQEAINMYRTRLKMYSERLSEAQRRELVRELMTDLGGPNGGNHRSNSKIQIPKSKKCPPSPP